MWSPYNIGVSPYSIGGSLYNIGISPYNIVISHYSIGGKNLICIWMVFLLLGCLNYYCQ